MKRWIPLLYISWEVGRYLTIFWDTGLEWELVLESIKPHVVRNSRTPQGARCSLIWKWWQGRLPENLSNLAGAARSGRGKARAPECALVTSPFCLQMHYAELLPIGKAGWPQHREVKMSIRTTPLRYE